MRKKSSQCLCGHHERCHFVLRQQMVFVLFFSMTLCAGDTACGCVECVNHTQTHTHSHTITSYSIVCQICAISNSICIRVDKMSNVSRCRFSMVFAWDLWSSTRFYLPLTAIRMPHNRDDVSNDTHAHTTFDVQNCMHKFTALNSIYFEKCKLHFIFIAKAVYTCTCGKLIGKSI